MAQTTATFTSDIYDTIENLCPGIDTSATDHYAIAQARGGNGTDGVGAGGNGGHGGGYARKNNITFAPSAGCNITAGIDKASIEVDGVGEIVRANDGNNDGTGITGDVLSNGGNGGHGGATNGGEGGKPGTASGNGADGADDSGLEEDGLEDGDGGDGGNIGNPGKAGKPGWVKITYTLLGASGPANVKTINSIPLANCKTWNGIPIENVKSINGVV